VTLELGIKTILMLMLMLMLLLMMMMMMMMMVRSLWEVGMLSAYAIDQIDAHCCRASTYFLLFFF
jgi:hypothetical protein